MVEIPPGTYDVTISATDYITQKKKISANAGLNRLYFAILPDQDDIAPTTEISLYGTQGTNGWHISDVQITLDATDNEDGTGIANTEYSLDSTTWYTYSGPITITDEGTITVLYRSTDNKGNIESTKEEIIKIDKTTPTLTLTVTPDTLWPLNKKMIDVVATLTVTDHIDQSPKVELTSIISNEPNDANGNSKTENDIQNADTGTEDYEFNLRAERSGSDSGRIYTITYTTTDAAGNIASKNVIVNVPHDQGNK